MKYPLPMIAARRQIYRIPRGAGQTFLPSSVVSAAYGIFGTKILVDGYTGDCCDVRRSDGGTTTLGFVNGVVDVAAAETFNNANSGGPDSLTVSRWYDQSGNGNDLTQSTENLKPALEVDGDLQAQAKDEFPIDGPGVVFNDAVAPTVAQAYMDNSAATGLDNQDIQFITVARFREQFSTSENTGPAGLPFQIKLSATNGFSFYSTFSRVNTVSPINPQFVRATFVGNGNFPQTGTTRPALTSNTQYQVVSIRSNGTNIRYKNGDWLELTAVSPTSGSGDGFRVGRCFGTSFTGAHIARAAILTTALSDADESAAMSALANSYGIGTNPTTLVGVEGDSISAGYKSGIYIHRVFPWVHTMAQNLGTSAIVFNQAQSGGWFGELDAPYGPMTNQDAGTQAVQQGPKAPDSLDPILNSSQFTKQILVVYLGSNDLGLFTGGDSVGSETPIHDAIDQYCTARQTAGWEVVVCDIIPREPFTAAQETARTNLNALIKANYTDYADAFVELSALDWTPGSSFATNYEDGIHPNATGQALIEGAVTPAVQTLIAA